MAELMRLIIAFLSRSALRLVLPFIPIKTDRVLFQSYREKRYACNPRYISEALSQIAGDKIEIAWSFRDPEKYKYLEQRGIKVLKAGSWQAIKYALSAKVVCVNTYYKPTLPRRKNQVQIRTWHGGGAYKKVGESENLSPLKRLSIKTQLSGASIYISSSEAFTKCTIRESFGFTGEVWNIGMPRNDMLINGISKDEELKIRQSIGLDADTKLALYAPTYRDDLKSDEHRLDAERLKTALETRFGDKWIVAFRGHVFVKKGEHELMDLSAYEDMQPLLAVAGALITDYSSSMWDMSLTYKPVFLYCPDADEYTNGRGFYTDISTWPYPLARTNEELEANVLSFNDEVNKANVYRHHENLGSYETGHAALSAANEIVNIISSACGKK